MTSFQPRKSDKYIPLYFVAFFVVLALIDGTFAYLATSTNTGVIDDEAYEDGITYNKTIAAAEAQAHLGLTPKITLAGTQLSFTLKTADGAPLQNAHVTAFFVRPTQDGHDFETPLPEQASGMYSAPIAFPMPGQWDVRIVTTWDAHNKTPQTYQAHKRLIVQP